MAVSYFKRHWKSEFWTLRFPIWSRFSNTVLFTIISSSTYCLHFRLEIRILSIYFSASILFPFYSIHSFFDFFDTFSESICIYTFIEFKNPRRVALLNIWLDTNSSLCHPTSFSSMPENPEVLTVAWGILSLLGKTTD